MAVCKNMSILIILLVLHSSLTLVGSIQFSRKSTHSVRYYTITFLLQESGTGGLPKQQRWEGDDYKFVNSVMSVRNILVSLSTQGVELQEETTLLFVKLKSSKFEATAQPYMKNSEIYYFYVDAVCVDIKPEGSIPWKIPLTHGLSAERQSGQSQTKRLHRMTKNKRLNLLFHAYIRIFIAVHRTYKPSFLFHAADSEYSFSHTGKSSSLSDRQKNITISKLMDLPRLRNNSMSNLNRPDGKDYPRFPPWASRSDNSSFCKPSHVIRSIANVLSIILFVDFVLTAVYTYFYGRVLAKKYNNRTVIKFFTYSFFFKWLWKQPKQNQRRPSTKVEQKLQNGCQSEKPVIDISPKSSTRQTSETNLLKDYIFRPWLLKSTWSTSLSRDNSIPPDCSFLNDSMCSTCHQHLTGFHHPTHLVIQVSPATQFLPNPTFNPDLDFAHVGYRLATLGSLPASVPVSRTKLADAGFYSQGHGDEVICYSCHVHHSGWSNGDDPLEIHRRLSPTCAHVISRDNELTSLASVNGASTRSATESNDRGQASALDGPQEHDHVEDSDRPHSEAHMNTISSGRESLNGNTSSNLGFPSSNSVTASGFASAQNGLLDTRSTVSTTNNTTNRSTTTEQPTSQSSNTANRSRTTELPASSTSNIANRSRTTEQPTSSTNNTANRSRTTEQPRISTTSTTSNTTNRYTTTEQPTVTTSSTSNNTTNRYTTTEQPTVTTSSTSNNTTNRSRTTEHPTATATSAGARNLPGVQSSDTNARNSNTSVGRSSRPAQSRSRSLFPQVRLELGGAVYPMYQDMASRRRSFTQPWDDSRAPPLNNVLLSGMFYGGYADCVRCFYCGVGLKHWVVTDDVWMEHIRWRPECGYLRAVKGDDFIRNMQRRLGIQIPSENTQPSAQGASATGNSQNVSPQSATTTTSLALPTPPPSISTPSASNGSATITATARTVTANATSDVTSTSQSHSSMTATTQSAAPVSDQSHSNLTTAMRNAGSVLSQSGANISTATTCAASVSSQCRTDTATIVTSTTTTNNAASVSSQSRANTTTTNATPTTTNSKAITNATLVSSLCHADTATTNAAPTTAAKTSTATTNAASVTSQSRPNTTTTNARPSTRTPTANVVSVLSQSHANTTTNATPTATATTSTVATNAGSVFSQSCTDTTITNTTATTTATTSTAITNATSVSSRFHANSTRAPTAALTTATTNAAATTTSTTTATTNTTAVPIATTTASTSNLASTSSQLSTSSAATATSSSIASGAASNLEREEGREREERRGGCGVEGEGDRAGARLSPELDENHQRQRVAQLQEENRRLSQRFRCRVCQQSAIDTILMPCGHLVVCGSCASTVTQCPLCQSDIRATASVFFDH